MRSGVNDWRPVLAAGFVLLVAFAVASKCHAEMRVGAGDTFPLPTVLDDDVHAAMHDERTVFYDERMIPRAYQNSGTFHWAGYNISAEGDIHGNANLEFPWDETAGAGENVYSVKFAHLPANRKIAFYRDSRDSRIGVQPVTVWIYPHGTIIGELLYKRLPDGQLICFELRIRQKVRDSWESTVFRPFPECEDMIAWMEKNQSERTDLIGFLKSRRRLRSERAADRQHRVMVIDRVYHLDVLPAFPADLQMQMSKVPFENAAGEVWLKDEEGKECYAPAGGIAPLDFRGTMAGNESESCMACHRTTMMPARLFDRPRGWYGFTRGSDTVFSLQPAVNPSTNGASHGWQWNPRVAHLFEPYDPRRHPRDEYILVGGR